MTPFRTGRSSRFIKLIDIDWIEMLERYGIVDAKCTGDLDDFEGMDLVLRYDYTSILVMKKGASLYDNCSPVISSLIDHVLVDGRKLQGGCVYELDKSQAMKVVTYLLVKSL